MPSSEKHSRHDSLSGDKLDREIANEIYEYLLWAKFQQSLPSFVLECQEKKLKLKPHPKILEKQSSQDSEKIKEKLLECLDSGDSEGFFYHWGESKFEKDETANVLQFYLRVFFATHLLREADNPKTLPKKSYDAALETLKEYLEEGEGSSLSQIPELVPYFALPYITNPKQHPLFKDLSQNSKSPDRNASRKDKNSSSLDRELEKVRKELDQSEKAGQKYKAQCGQIQKDYHKLITIASELVDVLEQSIQGAQVTPDYLEDITARMLETSKAASQVQGSPAKEVRNTHSNKTTKDASSAVSTQPPSL